jgi:hypothetical protein
MLTWLVAAAACCLVAADAAGCSSSACVFSLQGAENGGSKHTFDLSGACRDAARRDFTHTDTALHSYSAQVLARSVYSCCRLCWLRVRGAAAVVCDGCACEALLLSTGLRVVLSQLCGRPSTWTRCIPEGWQPAAAAGVVVQSWCAVPVRLSSLSARLIATAWCVRRCRRSSPPCCPTTANNCSATPSTGNCSTVVNRPDLCCTAPCEVLAVGPPVWRVADRDNPTSGGLIATFAPLPRPDNGAPKCTDVSAAPQQNCLTLSPSRRGAAAVLNSCPPLSPGSPVRHVHRRVQSPHPQDDAAVRVPERVQ